MKTVNNTLIQSFILFATLYLSGCTLQQDVTITGKSPTINAQAVNNWTAKWIWQPADGPANTWVSFRKSFNLTSVPSSAIANIAVDTKYWLWINGKLAVFEGGRGRGPSPNNTWYEEVDLKPYLQAGANNISVLVWYWGRTAAQHVSSGKGGLLFQADLGGTALVSDNTWKMKVNTAYDPASGGGGGSVAAYSVKYNAGLELGDWTSPGYNDTSWAAASVKGTGQSAPWNSLEKDYVPGWTDHGLQYYSNYPASSFPFTSTGGTYTCKVPANITLTPYLEVESDSGKVITIIAENLGKDNLRNYGGKDMAIQGIYTTKAGVQSFESYSWMNGQSIQYTIPAGVKVRALKYRWTSVGNAVGTFECNNSFYQKLWGMGVNTLMVCARDSFMDCPDRERTLWIGDVADQAGYLFYVMDDAGRQLFKKAIRVTIAYCLPDGFLGPGCPGWGGRNEFTSQSLQFISQGVWQYYLNTGDIETLNYAYPSIKNYLALWNMGANGIVAYRAGKNPWIDWGVDSANGVVPDQELIQVCQYYLALKSAKEMAKATGRTGDVAWYDSRITSIANNFNSVYWNGSYYRTGGNKEDRSNAWAIVAGLADSSKYASIVNNVLVPVIKASPHMEWLVEEAMCIAGKPDEALTRMYNRYAYQVNNTRQTTLNELFGSSGYTGTYNHAWNAPNTVLIRDIVGLAPDAAAWSAFHVLPRPASLSSINTVVPTVKGNVSVSITKGAGTFSMNITSPANTTAVVGMPKSIGTITEVRVNGAVVWNGSYVGGVSGITWNGEDSDFIKLNVTPGTWSFAASAHSGNPTPVGPDGYTFCANENQSYTFSQTVDVAYGANGKFAYKTGVTGTITFNNATFGDPIVGVPKKGYYKISTTGTIVTMRKSNALTFGIDGNNGEANGQLCYLWAYDPNNGNQQWDQIDRGGGYYSYQKHGTSYCLDGGNGGTNGQSVYLWTRNDSNQNQHWKKIDLRGGYYRLEKRNASGFSIDGGNGGANGQALKLWVSDNNNQNQRWLFTSIN